MRKNDLRGSIIICTCNRRHWLELTLATLARIDMRNFELVIVVAPSQDGTLEWLREHATYAKIVETEVLNLCVSRNLGIAAAAGEVVIFLDDDAYPLIEDWAQNFLDMFARDTAGRLGALGGTVLHKATNGREFYRGVISYSGLGYGVWTEAAYPPPGYFRAVQGCNCAFRRSALVEIGGFEPYMMSYLDENEVTCRLQAAGYRVEFLPHNAVRHLQAPNHLRTSSNEVAWDMTLRSWMFFGMKYGKQSKWQNFRRSFRENWQAYHTKEMIRRYRAAGATPEQKRTLLRQWFRGNWEGTRDGLRRPRHIERFEEAAPPFQPFSPPPAQAPRKLRVLLIDANIPAGTTPSGTGRQMLDLGNALYLRGHEVHLLTADSNAQRVERYDFFVHAIEYQSHEGVQLISPGVDGRIQYTTDVYAKILKLKAMDMAPDIIFTTNWDFSAPALLTRQIAPLVLCTVTSIAQLTELGEKIRDDDMELCIKLDEWQIDQAPAIVASSDGIVDNYKTIYGMDLRAKPLFRKIPLGVYPTYWPKKREKTGVKKLTWVSRLSQRKGAGDFLEALPKLLEQFPDWEAHLCGDDRVPFIDEQTSGPLKEEFLARHRSAPWLRRVFFHGMVSDPLLHHHYSTSDIMVCASWSESFGLIYHEAMQYGVPVVGCLTGGVPEVVADGVEGILVPVRDPVALGQALAKLMADDVLREKLGQNARVRVKERDNAFVYAQRMEEMFLAEIESWPRRKRPEPTRPFASENPVAATSVVA
ncbi:MAG: glycosyltransferase [Verrucomicrobia bacterium]|nr:glycosyltransferase [Verrucomicrobiota bacterium]